MKSGWSSDFSYDYFRRILQTVKTNFNICMFSEAPQFVNTLQERPNILVRHDIDYSLKKALKMADIEKDFGIRATYMVITNSPLYSVKDKASRNIFLKLIEYGHEIGLHFDFDDKDCNNYLIEARVDIISSACKQLEDIISQPVLSVSFHRPLPQLLRGPLIICDRVNAYAKELMNCYLSDSRGCWREGDPLPQILKLVKSGSPLLQLLMHPIWWGDKHMLPEERLQEYFLTETQGKSPQFVKAFDSAMSEVTSIRRKEPSSWSK